MSNGTRNKFLVRVEDEHKRIRVKQQGYGVYIHTFNCIIFFEILKIDFQKQ